MNLKQEISNYSALNLEKYAEAQVPENIRNSALLYNKALESIKNGNEDMAVIELKKAISGNPDFPEAMNLLGLCYMSMKDLAKASAIFDQVAAKENNGVKAEKYLSALNSNDQTTALAGKRKSAVKIKEPENSFIKDMVNIRKSEKKDIFKYVAGFAAGILIFFIIQSLFFSNGQSSTTVSTDPDSTLVKQTDNHKYDSLKKDYDKLKADLQAANNEISYYTNINKLGDVKDLLSQRKYEEAADLLVLLKSAEFKDADKQKFDELFAEVMPNALRLVTGDGRRMFSSGKFQEAIQKLSKAILYDDKWESIDR
ncbi:MAG TPA: tetratricopeptide repeat protein, partial [Clostridia bacterium]|nr:tetratricopeptide repeat protein [Clostridia bacterium]